MWMKNINKKYYQPNSKLSNFWKHNSLRMQMFTFHGHSFVLNPSKMSFPRSNEQKLVFFREAQSDLMLNWNEIVHRLFSNVSNTLQSKVWMWNRKIKSIKIQCWRCDKWTFCTWNRMAVKCLVRLTIAKYFLKVANRYISQPFQSN